MADVLTKAKRSALMARVRSAGNASTEQRLAHLLREHGITGWRRGAPLPGKPDFIFHTARLAIFVDGCFWHGCPRHRRTPKTHVVFWTTKLARNAQRDREVRRALRERGWRVLRIWEHELAQRNVAQLLRRIRGAFTRRG
jgi:DNA mismatch endonuclease (patch repair protein)